MATRKKATATTKATKVRAVTLTEKKVITQTKLVKVETLMYNPKPDQYFRFNAERDRFEFSEGKEANWQWQCIEWDCWLDEAWYDVDRAELLEALAELLKAAKKN